jgi:transaldolase
MDLIRDIRAIYDNYGYETEILAASVRNPPTSRTPPSSAPTCVTIPPACSATCSSTRYRQGP